MKIAIAADWLPTYGGAEHVLSSFLRAWPGTTLHTTVAAREKLGPIAHADIRTDPLLQCVFRLLRRHEILLPWMPHAMERMDFSSCDIVLSSSHAVGKGVIVPPTALHVCYCHTPMRYAWEMEAEYLNDFRLRGFLKKRVQRELKRLRRWDLSTAKRVDVFIANSTETQSRIRRIYGRESTIICPPVDSRFFAFDLAKRVGPSEGYFLAVGRLVPYKRFDLLIDLAHRKSISLTIAGTGPDLPRLRSLAGPTVTFAGYVPEEELPPLYAGARALLFPQKEDAGIVPMEAQACGTPVLAFGEGGVVDVVRENETGLFASAQTVEAFEDALVRFHARAWEPERIRAHAMQFHEEHFCSRMIAEVSSAYRRTFPSAKVA